MIVIIKDRISNRKEGKVYQSKWELGITKAPSGKDVATIKVVNNDLDNSIEPGTLSKEDLKCFIRHLRVLSKKMNNTNADDIPWPGNW